VHTRLQPRVTLNAPTKGRDGSVNDHAYGSHPDEDNPLKERRELVDQVGQHMFNGGRLGRLERRQGGFTQIR
jgi:hypothetical protein